MNKKNVRALVVENVEEHRSILCSTLCQYGVDARGVGTAEAAIEMIDSGQPDLIITNGMESVLSWELSFEMQKLWPTYRPYMVALFSFMHNKQKRLCEEHGFDICNNKPITLSDLLGWVEQAQSSKTPIFTAKSLEEIYKLQTSKESPADAKAKKKYKKQNK